MLVNLAFLMQRVKKYLKKIFVMINKDAFIHVFHALSYEKIKIFISYPLQTQLHTKIAKMSKNNPTSLCKKYISTPQEPNLIPLIPCVI